MCTLVLVGSRNSRLPVVLEDLGEDEKKKHVSLQFPEIVITVHLQSTHKKTATYAEAFAFWFS